MASSFSSSQNLYPSLVNPSSFVSVQLSGTDTYTRWEAQMLCLLESQELAGFVDGTFPPPPKTIIRSREDIIVSGGTTTDGAALAVVNEEYKMWRRSDRLVKGWILGSLHERVLDIVVRLSTARDVWLKLESTLAPKLRENKDEEHDKEESITMQQEEHIIHYPYPSMLNVANFISIKLTETNYSAWLRQIFSLLESQELESFVMDPHGRCPNINVTSEEYKLWKRTDRLLQGWILGSISSEEVILSLAKMDTSRDIMGKLEEMFVPDFDSRFIFKKTIMPPPPDEVATKENDRSRYLPLYKSVLIGNWETAKTFMDRNQDATTAIITESGLTVLHLTVGSGKYIDFLEKLVEYIPSDALTSLTSNYSDTALTIAAKVGNTEAAKILMKKNPSLLHIRNDKHMLPLYLAAQNGHRETLLYFHSISTDEDYEGQAGADHLSWIVTHGYIDIALDLIKRYPHVARLETSEMCVPPLIAIAEHGRGFFRSGFHLNFVKDCIYDYIRIPLELEKCYYIGYGGRVDVESQASSYVQALKQWRVHFARVWERLHFMLSDVIQLLVLLPNAKEIRRKKLTHHRAVQLVKCLCEGIRSTNDETAYVRRTSKPITIAASLGTFEIVEGIVDILPQAIWACDDKGHNIPQLAVINRSERVFSLLYQMSGFQQFITTRTDDFGNNMLHFAGKLAPPHKLNLVSGAALQMQRELQWFKAVANLMNPICKNTRNSANETPAMVFTREHRELVIAGEKWMKDTANSCTIAASLIITIVFAAAITVPGGNNDSSGLPIFSKNKGIPFWIFVISDALSLFTSTTSLPVADPGGCAWVRPHPPSSKNDSFYSWPESMATPSHPPPARMRPRRGTQGRTHKFQPRRSTPQSPPVTTRHRPPSQQDFLVAMPWRLVYGLVFLFLSITSMIMAFSTTVYLVFGEGRGWIIYPLAMLSLFPVSSFVTLQFPLLRDVLKKTWGRGLFRKQSDDPFY